MASRLPRILLTVLKGVFCGALVGFLIGGYVVVQTEEHVVQATDFSHVVFYQEAQSRFESTVLVAFVVVLAAIGPLIAFGSFGPWVRHSVYGLVACVAAVAVLGLLGAIITNQQPFNMYVGAKSTWIGFARTYGLPVAFLVGPVTGVLFGRKLHHRRERLNREHGKG